MSDRLMPALGTLRERMEVFSNDQSVDGSGGVSDNFVSLGHVWARVRSVLGNLNNGLDARNTKTSHSIVMRFRSDLKAGDRLLYRGKMLEILSSEDLNGRRAYLICRCSEIQATG